MSTGTTPSSLGASGGATGPVRAGFSPVVGNLAFGASAFDVYVTAGSQSRKSRTPASRAAAIWAFTSAGPYSAPSEKSCSHGTRRAPVP